MYFLQKESETGDLFPTLKKKINSSTSKLTIPLLMVLSHPEVLLHNNPAELGARQRVRKRDVSLQARTREGIGAWDTFQTLVSTAKKLGVNMYQYLQDRIAHTHTFPSLATLIEEQAKELQFAASWRGVT